MVINKLIDRTLIVFLTVFAVAAPLDAGLLLLRRDAPPPLLYSKKYGVDLATQKPGFFVALLWLEVALQWPLAVINLYGVLSGPRLPWWFRTTALVFGASYSTSMVCMLNSDYRSSRTEVVIPFGVTHLTNGVPPPHWLRFSSHSSWLAHMP